MTKWGKCKVIRGSTSVGCHFHRLPDGMMEKFGDLDSRPFASVSKRTETFLLCFVSFTHLKKGCCCYCQVQRVAVISWTTVTFLGLLLKEISCFLLLYQLLGNSWRCPPHPGLYEPLQRHSACHKPSEGDSYFCLTWCLHFGFLLLTSGLRDFPACFWHQKLCRSHLFLPQRGQAV